jgi:hypothetical protein
MKNRIASLFELDELLSPGTNGHSSGTRAQKPGAARRAASGAPANPAPARRSGKRKSHRVTQNADKGEPIRCEHAVPYKPVTPVDVQPPATPPAPMAPAPPTAQQLGDEYDVESFEETDEDSSMRLTGIEETELDESYLEEAEPEDDDREDESRSLGQPYDTSPGTADEYYEHRPPDSFAAQMTAVERDLADLASRVSTPDADAPASDAGRDDDDPAAAPAPQPPERRAGHAVFDEMAQGMAYATEFRLPAVQLSQVFSALDRELDAEQRQKVPAGQVPAPTAPQQPGASAPPAPAPETVIPDNRTLIADLVAMPAQPPDASPVEETTELDAGTTA